MSLRDKLIYFIAGWAVSRFIFSIFRDFEIGGLILEPGVVAVTFMPFLMLMDHKGSLWVRNLNFLFAGVICDSLLYTLVRPGNDILLADMAPFDAVIWAGSLGLLAIFLALFWIGSLNRNGLGREQHSKRYGWLIFACISAVVFFRVAYVLTLQVPNEQRSIFVAGVEVHHFAIGVLVLVSLMTRYSWSSVLEMPGRAALLGLATGMILDQSIYFSLKEISDASYGSPASFWGAVFLTVSFCTSAFLLLRSKRTQAVVI